MFSAQIPVASLRKRAKKHNKIRMNFAKPYADLREFIAALDANDKLYRIHREINKDTELQPLVRWQFRGGMPEEERPEGHHPVDVALALDRLQVGALSAPDEERMVESDRPHRPHRRVDPARYQALGLPRQVGLRLQSQAASSLAQYVTTKSAPAREIAVSDSIAACRSSSQPRAAAAFTIAYSPETL